MAKKKTGGGGAQTPFHGATGIRHGYAGEGEWNTNQKAKINGTSSRGSSLPQMRASAVTAADPSDMRPKTISVGGTLPPSNSPPSPAVQAQAPMPTPRSTATAPSATPAATRPATATGAATARPRTAAAPRAARVTMPATEPLLSMTTLGRGRSNGAPKQQTVGGISAQKANLVAANPNPAAAAERAAAPYGRNRVGNPRAIDPNGGMERTRANMERIGVAGDARATDSIRRTEQTRGASQFAGIGARDNGILGGMRGASVSSVGGDHRDAGSGALRAQADDVRHPLRSAARFASIPVAAAAATAGAVMAAPTIATGLASGAGTLARVAPRALPVLNSTPVRIARGAAGSMATRSVLNSDITRDETGASFAERHPNISGGIELGAGILAGGTIRGRSPSVPRPVNPDVAASQSLRERAAASRIRSGAPQGPVHTPGSPSDLMARSRALRTNAPQAGRVEVSPQSDAPADLMARSSSLRAAAARGRSTVPTPGRTVGTGSMSSNVTGAQVARSRPLPSHMEDTVTREAIDGPGPARPVTARNPAAGSAPTARPPSAPSVRVTPSRVTDPPPSGASHRSSPRTPGTGSSMSDSGAFPRIGGNTRTATVAPSVENGLTVRAATPFTRTGDGIPESERLGASLNRRLVMDGGVSQAPGGQPFRRTNPPVAPAEAPVRAPRAPRGAKGAAARAQAAEMSSGHVEDPGIPRTPATPPPLPRSAPPAPPETRSPSLPHSSLSDRSYGGATRLDRGRGITRGQYLRNEAYAPFPTIPPVQEPAPAPPVAPPTTPRAAAGRRQASVAAQTEGAGTTRSGGTVRTPARGVTNDAGMTAEEVALGEQAVLSRRPPVINKIGRPRKTQGFAGPSGIDHGAFSHASGGGLVRGEPNPTPIQSNHGFGRSNVRF